MTTFPTFDPSLLREPLGPRFAQIDHSGCRELAGFGDRCLAFGARVDKLLEGLRIDLDDIGHVELAAAHRAGQAAARAAVAWPATAVFALAVHPAPRPPDESIYRAHIEKAEVAANAKISARLNTLRRSVAAEFRSLLGEWREALDRADRLDPAERERAEAAYATACAIDISASFPRIVFSEQPAQRSAQPAP